MDGWFKGRSMDDSALANVAHTFSPMLEGGGGVAQGRLPGDRFDVGYVA